MTNVTASSSTTTTTTEEAKKSNSVAVSKAYERRFPDFPAAPWIDGNPHWRACLRENQWTRWDGTTGTSQEHMAWARDTMKALFGAAEFRPYGRHDGCEFFIHDDLTQQGHGFGCFKIEGRIFDVQPRDVLRLCFDMSKIIQLDTTTVFYKLYPSYAINNNNNNNNETSFVAPVYWSNDPGFPFYVRDGTDLTGFMRDEEDPNVIWQLGVGVAIDNYTSQPGRALKATDRYWAYRLEPAAGGTGTKVSIICQCCLNGWIPKFLSNYFVCKVLIDSLRTMEKTVAQIKATDAAEYKGILQEMGLEGW